MHAHRIKLFLVIQGYKFFMYLSEFVAVLQNSRAAQPYAYGTEA